MTPGECWIFDTWRRHRASTPPMMSAFIWLPTPLAARASGIAWIADKSPQGLPIAGWKPQPVAHQAGDVAWEFETVNVPTVMTPWEIREHINFLLGDAVAHPQLPGAQRLCSLFIRDWQALWSRYGEGARAGRSIVRAWMLSPAIWPVTLIASCCTTKRCSQTRWNVMVLRVALADRPMPARGDEYRQEPPTPAARGARERVGPIRPARVHRLATAIRLDPAVRDAGQGAARVYDRR